MVGVTDYMLFLIVSLLFVSLHCVPVPFSSVYLYPGYYWGKTLLVYSWDSVNSSFWTSFFYQYTLPAYLLMSSLYFCSLFVYIHDLDFSFSILLVFIFYSSSLFSFKQRSSRSDFIYDFLQEVDFPFTMVHFWIELSLFLSWFLPFIYLYIFSHIKKRVKKFFCLLVLYVFIVR